MVYEGFVYAGALISLCNSKLTASKAKLDVVDAAYCFVDTTAGKASR